MPARPHRTVERITRILELVAAHPGGYTLTEIATKMDEPKSSVQGFVNGLVDTGYLEELDKRYFLGAAPYMLTLRADRMPARNISHADVESLAQQLGCSVLIGILVGRSLVYIDASGGSAVTDYIVQRQPRRPALETAGGQLLLAALDQKELHDFLSHEPDQDAVLSFLERVDDIRLTGIVVKEQSLAPGLAVIGTVIPNPAGRATAALILSGPPATLLPRRTELTEAIRAAARIWSRPAH